MNYQVIHNPTTRTYRIRKLRNPAWVHTFWDLGAWADETFEYNYAGPIPVQDVIDHLFYWEPVEGELTVRIPVPDFDVADGVADGVPLLPPGLPRKARAAQLSSILSK